MADEPDKAADTVKLQFHYIKAPSYQESPCHGVLGGLTPQGKLWMAFYSERYPLPRLVEYMVPRKHGSVEIEFDERAGTPSHIDSREGVIRHVEFSAYLDISTAERLREWLDRHIAQAQMKSAP